MTAPAWHERDIIKNRERILALEKQVASLKETNKDQAYRIESLEESIYLLGLGDADDV
jgi:hypothetical protein